MEQKFETLVLENGVRIVTQKVPAVRSASFGIWVGTGSRHEKNNESGAAHFIEHMVFKGTETRSAIELAQEMDAIGGHINAYTSKETTCFYGRCLDTHLPRAVDLLWDMIFCSKFDEEDVKTERGVILEEIGMYQDNPEDLCTERLTAGIYKGSSLGRPILGKKATLEKMTGEWLKEYKNSHYTPDKIVVALAGSFTDAQIEDLKTRFSTLTVGKDYTDKPATYQPMVSLKKKAIEQNHITMAFPGISYSDPRRFAFQLLSSILGGGMSSRLFQEVREKQGLCYSVYTYGMGQTETGIFAVYTALGKETEAQAIKTICKVIREFVKEGPTQEELDRAREMSKISVLMGLESTHARMNNLGRGTLVHGKVMTPDETIAAYDAVTVEAVLEAAKEIFDFQRVALSVVGRVTTEEEYKKMMS